MDYMPAVDPILSVSPSLIDRSAPQGPEAVKEEFMAVFFMQLMKQFLSEQKNNSLFGESSSAYGETFYNDLFVQEISRQMAKDNAFGFKELIKETGKL